MKIHVTFLILILLFGCEKSDTLKIEPLSSEGITWVNLTLDENSNLSIDSVMVSYEEIIAYDTSDYIYLLSSTAGERIRMHEYGQGCESFGIALDGELRIKACFVPGFTNYYVNEICVSPYSSAYKYQFKLGYPTSLQYDGEDFRNDSLIVLRLAEDNKIKDIEL